MGDVKFSCPACGQHCVIDERVAGYWVTCPECATPFQVPKPAPLPHPFQPPPPPRRTPVERIPLKARLRVRLPDWRFRLSLPKWRTQPLGLLSLMVLAPLCGIAWWAQPRTGMAGPVHPHSPRMLIAKTEEDLMADRVSEAADTMRELMAAFPRSDEAHTLSALIRIVRNTDPGRTADPPASCNESDALLIRRQIGIKEALLATYTNLPPERRAPYDRLFGATTFERPDLSLKGILATLNQVESFRTREQDRNSAGPARASD